MYIWHIDIQLYWEQTVETKKYAQIYLTLQMTSEPVAVCYSKYAVLNISIPIIK